MDKPRHPHVIRTWTTGQFRPPAQAPTPRQGPARTQPHAPDKQPPQKGKRT